MGRHYTYDSWKTTDPRDEEPIECKHCHGEGDIPLCELEGCECTCSTKLDRIGCGRVCENCGGNGWT